MCAVYTLRWGMQHLHFFRWREIFFFLNCFIQLMRNTTTNDVIIIVTKASYYNGLVLQSSLIFFWLFKKKFNYSMLPHDDEIHGIRNWTVVFFHAGVRPWPFPSFPLKLHHAKEFHFWFCRVFFFPFPDCIIIASPGFHHPFWLFAVRSW